MPERFWVTSPSRRWPIGWDGAARFSSCCWARPSCCPRHFWGSVSDRLGRSEAHGIATLVTALGVGGMIAMTFGAPLWLVYLTIALYGVGHSAGNPTYGAVIGDIFSGH